MPSLKHRRQRLGLGLVTAILTALGAVGIVAAHHADVIASYQCDGNVQFTASAWNGPDDGSMTNSDIGVWYSLDGGALVELTSAAYRFNPQNGFTFSDSFSAAGATQVTVRVQAQANWGNSSAPGDAREVSVTKPTGCATPAPSPTPTPTPTPTPDPTPTPTPDPTPTPTPSPTTEVQGSTSEPTLPPTDGISGGTAGDGGITGALVTLGAVIVAAFILRPPAARYRIRKL